MSWPPLLLLLLLLLCRRRRRSHRHLCRHAAAAAAAAAAATAGAAAVAVVTRSCARFKNENKKQKTKDSLLCKRLCSAMHRGSSSWIVLRDASRIVEQQQQHSSSSSSSSSGGGDVAAAAAVSSPLESWAVVLCLLRSMCFVFASWLWATHQQKRGFLQQQRTCYAVAVMTTVVGGKRTLLPVTRTPCRVSRQVHHTASSNVPPVALNAGLPTQSQTTR